MNRRILHVSAQRPLQTGSGITLDALVRHGAAAGWDQWAVVGTSADDPCPAVGGLAQERIAPLSFGREPLAFPVPGMSDVMPYPSTRYSAMTEAQHHQYREAWREHLRRVVDRVEPELIHVHHVWIVSALLKDVAPGIPVVTHCHATGLRQLELCLHRAEEVREGCARNERFVVLHRGHAELLRTELGVSADRIHVVGAGYRDELFHRRGRGAVAPGELLYVGKLSAAKGLPWLLDAVERLGDRARARGSLGASEPARLRLHVVGSGSGWEAKALRERMARMPSVRYQGPLSQSELAERMRHSAVCVLPSFYEGVPLVLVEALACGCRLVATALPGVLDQLAPSLGDALDLVALPHMIGPDRPRPASLPEFVDRLTAALAQAMLAPPGAAAPSLSDRLAPFTWRTVFRRVEAVWQEQLPSTAAGDQSSRPA